MSVTREESELLELGENLPEPLRQAVHLGITAVTDAVRAGGIKPATDDRAARLEAAIVRFIVQSNE